MLMVGVTARLHFCFTNKILILKEYSAWLFFDQVKGKACATVLSAWSTHVTHRLIHKICG